MGESDFNIYSFMYLHLRVFEKLLAFSFLCNSLKKRDEYYDLEKGYRMAIENKRAECASMSRKMHSDTFLKIYSSLEENSVSLEGNKVELLSEKSTEASRYEDLTTRLDLVYTKVDSFSSKKKELTAQHEKVSNELQNMNIEKIHKAISSVVNKNILRLYMVIWKKREIFRIEKGIIPENLQKLNKVN